MERNAVDMPVSNPIIKKTEAQKFFVIGYSKNSSNLDAQKKQITTSLSDNTSNIVLNNLSGATTKLTGFNKTLNSLKSETDDTYLIEHNSGPITFSENTSPTKTSGSYSGTMNSQEDEQEENDTQEEERLNKKEIANQNIFNNKNLESTQQTLKNTN
ncbi:hypothetical protein BCD_1128 (plasmid) [Borrelia crocidurae DOU]|uniref:Uncharacterized protein n=1 Tax=Borrelia crocidurae DOU TaxID=1293575 RepID=W5SJ69_9SPIR|nr:hypothetical protein [Borrelia crocidurae]AHH07194.1 hypothetical protein BCD_1128 [Borrelia crocidurae DOU]